MALNTTRTENNLLLCYLLFDSHTSSNICIISERSTLLCGGTWKVSVFSLVSIFTSSLNVVPDSVTLTLKRLTSLVWVKEKMKSPLPCYTYFLLKDKKHTFRGGQMQAIWLLRRILGRFPAQRSKVCVKSVEPPRCKFESQIPPRVGR